ncbi:RNase A-like domain-containing protein [Euzebya sp.]|uniref:RNase A-like domain-containing protein n=1 Tax=Euzebya sp. TaxID=1971409 RepID=UPI003511D411
MRTVARACRGDRGQTTVEWLGVAAVSVAIIVALIAIAGRLGEQIQSASEAEICRAATDDDCGGGAGGGAADQVADVDGSGTAGDAVGGDADGGDAAAGAGADGGSAADGGAAASGGGGGGDAGGDDGGGGIGGLISDIGGGIADGVGAIGGGIADGVGAIGGGIADGVGAVGGVVADAGSAVLGVGEAAVDGLGTVVGGVVDGTGALLNGFVLGDYGGSEDSGVLETIRVGGQILSGILIVGDVRDGVRAVQHGDEVTLGLIAVGLIPGYGDVIRGGSTAAEAAIDGARAVDDVADAAADAGRAGDDAVRAGDDAGDAVADGRRGDFCSFGAGTRVVMADGTSRPIVDVRVGDRVLAADPAVDRWSIRTVTATWVHHDVLVELRTDRGTVVTTADHPFWDDVDGDWEAAGTLDAGDRLRTTGGDSIAIVGVDASDPTTAPAHNLTVSGPHTYAIDVGGAAVLVHNQNGCDAPPGGGLEGHEGPNPGQGHTIERHVGRTDQQLIDRANGPNAPTAASTFPDLDTANRAVGTVITENPDVVADILASGQRQAIEAHLPTTTGRVVQRGSDVVEEVNGVRVVIQPDPSAPAGYTIITSYPVP